MSWQSYVDDQLLATKVNHSTGFKIVNMSNLSSDCVQSCDLRARREHLGNKRRVYRHSRRAEAHRHQLREYGRSAYVRPHHRRHQVRPTQHIHYLSDGSVYFWYVKFFCDQVHVPVCHGPGDAREEGNQRGPHHEDRAGHADKCLRGAHCGWAGNISGFSLRGEELRTWKAKALQ